MQEWKLELHKDILNSRNAFYPSVLHRTQHYEMYYRDRVGRKEKAKSGSHYETSCPAEFPVPAVNYDPQQPRDERKTETPFAAMLALYGKDGCEYTFSRLGMRHMERTMPWQGHYHTHDYIEILYVIHGSFEQILLGERQKFISGEFVITDRNLEHADYLSGEEDAAVLFLSMQSGYLDRLLGSCDSSDDLQHFFFHALQRQRKEQSYLHLTPSGPVSEMKEREKAGMEQVLEMLVREDWNPAEGSPDIIKGALIRLFSILCRSYSMKLHSSDRESRERLFLYELERYIRMMRGQVDSVMLEQLFHYHRNYFNRILQKYRGMSFRDYTQKIRLDYAASLLAETSLPVRETAARAGWNNSSHFYHLFEEHFGMSPAQYRKSRKNRLPSNYVLEMDARKKSLKNIM